MCKIIRSADPSNQYKETEMGFFVLLLEPSGVYTEGEKYQRRKRRVVHERLLKIERAQCETLFCFCFCPFLLL